ncbi:TPA: hypothetical protein ACH3X2_012812 [Trebouxia sp. C0005]
MALCNAWGIESPGESAAAPSGCPNDLWQEFQKLRKAQTTGRAKWWSQWELVLYKASDTRIGVVIEKGDIKLRHKQCGAEYGTKNFSQTATKHSCDKARASANENVINSKEPTSKKRKSIDNYFWSGPQQKRLKRLLAQILFENSSSVSFSLIECYLCGGSLRPHDQESVETLPKRLAGHGSQEAVIAELMQFISAGFAIANADFAAAARARIKVKAKGQGKDREVLKPAAIRRSVWETTMQSSFPILTRIAIRLLSLHAIGSYLSPRMLI